MSTEDEGPILKMGEPLYEMQNQRIAPRTYFKLFTGKAPDVEEALNEWTAYEPVKVKRTQLSSTHTSTGMVEYGVLVTYEKQP